MDWEGEGSEGDEVFCVSSMETEAEAEREEDSTLEIVSVSEALAVAVFAEEIESVAVWSGVKDCDCDSSEETECVFVLEFGYPMMKRQMCGSACVHAKVVSVLLPG